MHSETFKAFICYNFDDYGLQLWKPFHNILILTLGLTL